MPRGHALRGGSPARTAGCAALWLLLLVALAAAWAPAARGQSGAPAPRASAAEVALAERYAPEVRLRQQPDACVEDGVPYVPIDVELLMGNDEVALRGPWDRVNLVGVAPTAERLAQGLWEYHLDFPGDALEPGCDYEHWAARVQAGSPPTAYARVVTDPGHPGKLALQYWFYYLFNDWKNTHEGDWEMIQLVFDAATPAEALATRPTEVGYSQHSSAERADWGDGKLEVVDGTHPVVYPAAGSQANFFGSRLYLMRSQAEGVGCDDTRGPTTAVRPVIRTIPSDPADYLRAYPWLGFEGRWGEKQRSFFNGPTGPNDKRQWTEPIGWSEDRWRDESFVVPASGAVGTSATDLFCGAVEIGSEVLRQIKLHPGAALIVIGGLAVLVAWGLSRAAWRPTTPLRVARRRSWGQIMTASWRLLVRHPGTFLGIGLLFVPLGLLTTLVQYLVFQLVALAPLVDEAGERNAFVDALVVGLGLAITFLGFAVMQAATAWTMAEIDEGRRPSPLTAYRSVLRGRRLRPLVGALVIAFAVQVVLDLTVVLIPIAVYLLVWWSLFAVSVGVEGRPDGGALRRSGRLVRGSWWRAAAVAAVAGAALLLGPAIGVLVLLFTGAAFDFVNMIAAVVYVCALPFVAIALTYLYFDLRVRQEARAREPAPQGELPSELDGPIAAG